MKLHHTNASLVLFSYDRIRKALCGKCLAHARRTLQDNVFLAEKQGTKLVVFLFGDEDVG